MKIEWTMYDELVEATPEYLEEIMCTVLTPAGYRYVEPVSCVAGPNLRGTSNGAKWTRIWPRVDRRVDSRCSSGELHDLARTCRFPCSD